MYRYLLSTYVPSGDDRTDLNNIEREIHARLERNTENLLRTAQLLREVKQRNLTKSKDFYRWAKELFGFGRTHTDNFLAIGAVITPEVMQGRSLSFNALNELRQTRPELLAALIQMTPDNTTAAKMKAARDAAHAALEAGGSLEEAEAAARAALQEPKVRNKGSGGAAQRAQAPGLIAQQQADQVLQNVSGLGAVLDALVAGHEAGQPVKLETVTQIASQIRGLAERAEQLAREVEARGGPAFAAQAFTAVTYSSAAQPPEVAAQVFTAVTYSSAAQPPGVDAPASAAGGATPEGPAAVARGPEQPGGVELTLTPAQFRHRFGAGMVIDESDNAYVVAHDGQGILKFAPSGEVTTQAVLRMRVQEAGRGQAPRKKRR